MSSEYEGAQTNHENRVGSPLGNWDEFFEEIDWRDWSSRSSTAAVQFVRPVASYSWDIRAEPPRLHIPGAPRCIDLDDIGNMESAIGKSMAKDGVFPKDENQFRLRNESNGCFPTEPIFLAMHACSREGLECTLDDVDCICDSNTLCKLIAWMRGDSSIVTVSERNQEAEAVESFAFDMEMVGRKTLLLTRVEEDNIVQPNASKPTFGPSFEKLIGIVPQGFQHCSSFYRVSMIRIGELKVLVRSQVDAVNSGLPNERYIEENTWLEGLSEGSLQWRKCGSCVALTSDVIELKTKSAKAKSKQWAWNEWHPQMFFRGATHLAPGFHKEGVITKQPTIIPFCDVEQKADSSKDAMPILAPLLTELRGLALQDGRLCVRCDGLQRANLKISHSKRPSRVPPCIQSSWPELKHCFGLDLREQIAASTSRSSLAGSSSLSSYTNSLASSHSTIPANIHPAKVSLHALTPVLVRGELPSWGTASHGSNCFPCVHNARGNCGKGSACRRCHADHPLSEASHLGGRQRQRAARRRHQQQGYAITEDH